MLCGWVEQIPFDRIIFTAATKNISSNIFSQIKENGVIAGDDVDNVGVSDAIRWFFDNEKLTVIGRQWMVDLGQ